MGANQRCLGIRRPIADRNIPQDDEMQSEDCELSGYDSKYDSLEVMGYNYRVFFSLVYKVCVDIQIDVEFGNDSIARSSGFAKRPDRIVSSSIQIPTRIISEPSDGAYMIHFGDILCIYLIIAL